MMGGGRWWWVVLVWFGLAREVAGKQAEEE
jgi:hypothetical protein